MNNSDFQGRASITFLPPQTVKPKHLGSDGQKPGCCVRGSKVMSGLTSMTSWSVRLQDGWVAGQALARPHQAHIVDQLTAVMETLTYSLRNLARAVCSTFEILFVWFFLRFCDCTVLNTHTHTLCPLKCNPSDRKASKKDSIIRHRQESNVFCFVFLHLLFKSRTLLIVWLISDSFPHFLCDRAT